MPSPETPTQTQPEQPPSHVAPAIGDAQKVIGKMPQESAKPGTWDRKDVDQRIEEKMQKKELTVQDVLGFNADIDRRFATDLVEKLNREKRMPTKEEKRELLGAQVRVSLNESLARALDQYMELMTVYGDLKANGLSASAREEQDAFRHLELVKKAAQTRVEVATKARGRYSDPETTKKDIMNADRELTRLLVCTDKDIPGANKDGILPVFHLMLDTLEKEYKEYTDQYKKIGSKGLDGAKVRLDQVEPKIREKFAGKKQQDITPEELDAFLKTLTVDGKPYSLVQRNMDLQAAESGSTVSARLRTIGNRNITQLIQLTRTMNAYHVGRLELVTVRHHFNQAYGWPSDSDTIKYPGNPSTDAQIAEVEKWLDIQRNGTVGTIDEHLDKVEKGVMKVGTAEKAETFWNNKGSVFFGRIADMIATFETAWLPDIGGYSSSKRAREYLMGGLYDSMGWPRGKDGQPKEWKDLTAEEKTKMEEKRGSVEKTIEQFRETKVLTKYRSANNVVRLMNERKDLAARDQLSTKGKMDASEIPKEEVTEQNMDQLIAKYGVPAVYVKAFQQLGDASEEYGEHYGKMLIDMHNVVGDHFDAQRYWNDFGRKQQTIAEALALLAISWPYLAGVLSALAATFVTRAGRFVIGKTAKGVWELTKLGGQGISKVAEKGVDVLKQVPKGRLLGHLGFMLSEATGIYFIQEDVRRNLRLQTLEGTELTDAALEFWKGDVIPGSFGTKLSEGREGAHAEEIAVIQKRQDVEKLLSIMERQTLPLPPEIPADTLMTPRQRGVLAEARNAATELQKRYASLTERHRALHSALKDEHGLLEIELPYLEQILVKDPKKPNTYGVNTSGADKFGIIPGQKIEGGVINDALRAGAGNRERHRQLLRSGLAAVDISRKTGIPLEQLEKTREQLLKRKTTEEYAKDFVELQKDMEKYIANCSMLDDRVRYTPGAVSKVDTRRVEAGERYGSSIDDPLPIHPDTPPSEIGANGKRVYLQLPSKDWKWAVNAEGTIPTTDIYGVNQSGLDGGKLSFQGKGKLSFWKEGDQKPRFEIEVK